MDDEIPVKEKQNDGQVVPDSPLDGQPDPDPMGS